MINSCELLNLRLWNLSEHYDKKWHFVDGDYKKESKYYFHSFIYRLGSVIWWAKKIEDELVYLDTTIADKEDLDFLKFCKFINITLSQAKLFDKIEYDGSLDKDHFYHHKLTKQTSCLTNSDKTNIIDYNEYEIDLENKLNEMEGLCKFIDGIHPTEDRLRWNRLYSLHLIVVAFLNNYGYDFQKINYNQIEEIIDTISLSNNSDIVLSNLIYLLKKSKLDNNIEISNIKCITNQRRGTRLHCGKFEFLIYQFRYIKYKIFK